MTLMHAQEIMFDWCHRVFGDRIALNRRERVIRIVEETIELAQAAQVDQAMVERLVQVVYSRSCGYQDKEVGDIMVSLLVFAEQQGYSLEALMHRQIRACLATDPVRLRARMDEKLASGVGYKD